MDCSCWMGRNRGPYLIGYFFPSFFIQLLFHADSVHLDTFLFVVTSNRGSRILSSHPLRCRAHSGSSSRGSSLLPRRNIHTVVRETPLRNPSYLRYLNTSAVTMLEFTFNVATAVIQILSMMSIMAPQVRLFLPFLAVYAVWNTDIA